MMKYLTSEIFDE